MSFLVNVDVPDLDAATRFYCDAFDLRVARRFGPHAVELVGGPTPIYLLVKRAGSKAVPESDHERDYARHWSPVHLDFVVDDLEAATERVLAAGATPESTARTHRWGKLAMFADPFGHGFCLIEFVGRGYDEIAT